ncbi:MAG: TOBE domain-containing protein [Pseudomonadota bacterium]|nr:TOBE domain-containing protein [Pseudomonadota bacterium]
MVQLRAGEDLLLARVTRRSSQALGLVPGLACHAVIKSVAVAPGGVGRG